MCIVYLPQPPSILFKKKTSKYLYLVHVIKHQNNLIEMKFVKWTNLQTMYLSKMMFMVVELSMIFIKVDDPRPLKLTFLVWWFRKLTFASLCMLLTSLEVLGYASHGHQGKSTFQGTKFSVTLVYWWMNCHIHKSYEIWLDWYLFHEGVSV